MGDNSDIVLPKPAYKVQQLDSIQLDEELSRILRHMIEGVLNVFNPSLRLRWYDWVERVSLMLAKYAPVIWFGRTFGMEIQSLAFRNAPGKSKLVLFILLDILWPLLVRRVDFFETLELFNLLIFLHKGQYPSIIHRLTNIALGPEQPDGQPAPSVDLEYMRRQLWWQAMTELALIAGPWLRKILCKAQGLVVANQKTVLKIGSLSTQDGYCLICQRQPAMRITFKKCNHLTCYYCFHQQRLDINACPVCK